MRPCFQKSNFLLPNSTIDMQAWSVIACDQYTSQQDYWQNVQEIIQDKPSTYHMIYPEVYLQEKGDRISKIQKTMGNYVHNNILEEKVKDAMYSLLQTKENCGIFLQRIQKSALFPAIVAGGVLPRKTFSMGEADEKRFYLEARWIKEKESH